MSMRLLITTIMVWAVPTFALAQEGKGLGYVFADKPTEKSYTPSSTYSYNSCGEHPKIVRTGVGVYRVRFPGLGGNGKEGGSVQVTAYGGSSESCKVAKWGSRGKDFNLYVRCFTVSGNPVDTRFTARVDWPPGLTQIRGILHPMVMDKSSGSGDRGKSVKIGKVERINLDQKFDQVTPGDIDAIRRQIYAILRKLDEITTQLSQ